MGKFRRAKKRRQDGPKRTGSGSSIRGKISAPIPIINEHELLHPTPGAGTAIPVGIMDDEKGLEAEEVNGDEHQSLPHEDGVAATDLNNQEAHEDLTNMPLRPPPEVPAPVTDEPSSFRSSTPSKANVEKAQRKKSSLKSVFGRLFGKKKKVELNDQRVGQHRSDPTALKRASDGAANAQARSASMPVTEFNRALRSHSVLLDDFPVYNDQKEPNRDSIVADGHKRPRRATTPSRLWTPKKPVGYVDWTGLTPRPASTHVRESWIADVDANAPIGMAVTSGSHPNRRSRSHGELREAMQSHPLPRRRSDEIRYWRESYDPGFMSPMSSNKAETEEHTIGEDGVTADREPQEEPQPFNFGLMGEMAGMKITQAANLETRVQRLEARVGDMERSVSRIRYRESTGTVVLHDAPRRMSNNARSMSASRPRTQDSDSSLPTQPRYRTSLQQQQRSGAEDYNSQNRSSSYDSSRLSTKVTNISYQPSLENISPDRATHPHSPIPTRSSPNTTRPLSTSTTIRVFPSSSPPTSKDGSLTIEHYTALSNMILAEQAARQSLEAMVFSLQQQIQILRARTSVPTTLYPTSGTVLKVDPPSEVDHVSLCGEFSSFEQDDSSDDDGEGRCVREEFQTPREESGRFLDDGDGIFGSELGEREPRTLSLSQITLGAGVGQQRV